MTLLKLKFFLIKKIYSIYFLGCWNNFIWRTPFYLKKHELSQANTHKIDVNILSYLKKGNIVVTTRTFGWKCITGEFIIGSPSIYTDGQFVWSTEYIYYVEKGKIQVPKFFLKKIKNNKYVIPNIKDISKKKLELISLII